MKYGELVNDTVTDLSKVEPDVCRHLVIAGASCMELFADVTNTISQCLFNVHVHIFEFDLNNHLVADFNFHFGGCGLGGENWPKGIGLGGVVRAGMAGGRGGVFVLRRLASDLNDR